MAEKLTEKEKEIRKKVLDELEKAIMSLPKEALPDEDEAMAVELGVSKMDKEDAEKLADEGEEVDEEDFDEFLEKMKKKKKAKKSNN